MRHGFVCTRQLHCETQQSSNVGWQFVWRSLAAAMNRHLKMHQCSSRMCVSFNLTPCVCVWSPPALTPGAWPRLPPRPRLPAWPCQPSPIPVLALCPWPASWLGSGHILAWFTHPSVCSGHRYTRGTRTDISFYLSSSATE